MKIFSRNKAILHIIYQGVEYSDKPFRRFQGDDSVDTRELFARLIECEAGGEGENGMKAVATVIMNRATVPYGEFARVSNGGDIRAIIEQAGQFVCMMTTVGGEYNPQNVYNITPSSESYEIADWAIDGNLLIQSPIVYFL